MKKNVSNPCRFHKSFTYERWLYVQPKSHVKIIGHRPTFSTNAKFVTLPPNQNGDAVWVWAFQRRRKSYYCWIFIEDVIEIWWAETKYNIFFINPFHGRMEKLRRNRSEVDTGFVCLSLCMSVVKIMATELAPNLSGKFFWNFRQRIRVLL